MMLAFIIIALLTIAGAVAAMTLRNLIHCALAMAVAFGGLAMLYLQLDAQFVGFTQVLVYIGAVAILIVFAILLTRGGEAPEKRLFSSSWVLGAGVGIAVFGALVWAISNSFVNEPKAEKGVAPTVKEIGDALMTQYVLPLEVMGLLLTAALIGAVIIALRDTSAAPKSTVDKSQGGGGHS
jgi:NADH-quinone oxidoreductase subunit J